MAGRPPNVGVVTEVEATLGTMLGAEDPTEGFRRLVTKQSAGTETSGGSWAGVGVVRHQVHILEGAGAEVGETEAGAPGLVEQEEEWEQQAGWSKATRGKRQVMEEDAPDVRVEAAQAGMPKKAQAQPRGERAAAESYEKRQMLWKGMAGRGWTELVQRWDVPQVEALQLQKSIAPLMREVGPKLGGLHWKEPTGLERESRVLSEEALSMLQAARDVMRLREPGLCGEKGQGRWTAKKLLQWAAKELAASRRDLDLQFEDIRDWAQREAMERKMGDSLLRWLGRDKPPQHRVMHKVWKKQLDVRTWQLLLGADSARQRTELEMLDGTDIVREVEAAGAWHEAAGAGPESESESESESGPEDEEGGSWEDWDNENWVEGTGVDQVGAGAEARADEPETEPASDESWWEVTYGSTVEGAARATELEVALQAFAATVEVDGAHGDGQLAK